ncbi:MAG: hypothetical protein IKL65_00525 [Bacilli bacterium]|nr:hypothetical protein [Bacilli bacterium]MBR6689801.1 hypothetical protein [Bacilli bacterium]
MESPTYEDFTRSYANKLSKEELIEELVFYASKYHKILEYINNKEKGPNK